MTIVRDVGVERNFDPILLEVMKNEFSAIGDEMAYTAQRAGRSFSAREGAEFMVGLLDRRGRLIARSSRALGTWYLVTMMPWVLQKYEGRFRPGDIVLNNDPYLGASHSNDMVVVMPIFWEGNLVAFSGSSEHYPDVGGRGGFAPDSRDVYEEGMRFPAVLLHEAGQANETLLEVMAANTRSPDDLLGDLQGQIVGMRRGEEGYLRLIRKYGLDTVTAYGDHLINYTERQLRDAIASLPRGAWVAEQQHDSDGMGGLGPKIVVRVEVEGDTLTLDYTGSSPQTKNAVNITPQLLRTLGHDVVRNALGLDVPSNSGMLSPIKVIAPEGTVVNPRFPAANGARGLSLPYGALPAALSEIMPERMPAADAGTPGHFVFSWHDGNGAAGVLFEVYQVGTGGRPNSDGVDGGGGNSSSGGLLSVPAEVIETEHPVVIEGFGLAPNTGGPGKFRGALSTYRSWRFLAEGLVRIRNLGYDRVALGAAGGENGTRSTVTLRRGSEVVGLPAQSSLDINVRPGDVLTHIQAGPAGYGDPWTRDPRMVLEDVLDEKVTLEYAKREYGVVIDPDTFQVDERATSEFRRRPKAAPSDRRQAAVTVRRA